MSDRAEINAILKQVESWPSELREELAKELLTSLGARHPKSGLRVEDFIGLLRTDGPAPTDAQVKQWIDEHRMEKYGG
jgi:hypothetical protein